MNEKPERVRVCKKKMRKKGKKEEERMESLRGIPKSGDN